MTEENEQDEEEQVCKACGSGFDSADELQEAIEEKKSSSEDEEGYNERIDFKVYNLPIEVKNKYVSLAKLEYDNQMWKVLEAGMDALLEERNRKVPELEEKVDKLQKQIAFLKVKIEDLESKDLSEKDESGPPKTFGDQKKEAETQEGGGELLDRFSNQ